MDSDPRYGFLSCLSRFRSGPCLSRAGGRTRTAPQDAQSSIWATMCGPRRPFEPSACQDMPERLERRTAVMREPASKPAYVQHAGHKAHEHGDDGVATICLCSRRIPETPLLQRRGRVLFGAQTRSLRTSIFRIRSRLVHARTAPHARVPLLRLEGRKAGRAAFESRMGGLVSLLACVAVDGNTRVVPPRCPPRSPEESGGAGSDDRPAQRPRAALRRFHGRSPTARCGPARWPPAVVLPASSVYLNWKAGFAARTVAPSRLNTSSLQLLLQPLVVFQSSW